MTAHLEVGQHEDGLMTTVAATIRKAKVFTLDRGLTGVCRSSFCRDISENPCDSAGAIKLQCVSESASQ